MNLTADTYQRFYAKLISEVNDYFTRNGLSRKANRWFFVKASIYFIALLLSYLILFVARYEEYFLLLYLFHGLLAFFFNLNVSHDAAHNAVFKSSKHNKLLFYGSFLLLGNSAWLWKNNHCHMHHPVPNVKEKDPDLIMTPLLRFFPEQKSRWFHKGQWLYAVVLYALHAPVYYFISEPHIILKHQQMSIAEKGIAFLGKAFHIVYLLIIPWLFTSLMWVDVLLYFVLLQMAISLVLVFGLGVSHLNNKVRFFEGDTDAHPVAIQLHSSLDYGGHCRITHFLMGGFNLHGLHHLFPNVCHTHYLNLVHILKANARALDIPYETVRYSNILASHFELLFAMRQSNAQIVYQSKF
ncbi:MAG: acyl-CoA desaturase [Cryomorphaceae bacterium]|nr:acyl-CoA desaturase [Cryomorphaceae bacterium]